MAGEVSAFEDGAESSESEGASLLSSINVTPFVDVVLVLLVIFIVTAPTILKDSLQIRLPKAASETAKSSVSLGVAVTRDGQLLLNGQSVTPEALSAAAQSALQKNPDAQAMISADQDARHGDVVRAIDLIKSAGLTRFAIQIEHQ